MNKYLFLYMSKSTDKTEMSDDGTKAWMDYFTKIGANLVDEGNPFGNRQSVMCKNQDEKECKECNDGCDMHCKMMTSGYSIVKANTLDEAVKLTEGNPNLETGSIEVIELIDMSGEHKV